MAGGQATNFTARQAGVLMLRIKSGAIRNAVSKAAPKTPEQTQKALRRLVRSNLGLQKWMKVAGMGIPELERMIRHAM